ncbi:hypothetical protein [Sphaerochaeta sp. PS]|uniref:hypothetical protein n=1 Tax=Sphaerochaeta sp. PS TaxID=3076336 RepID=UPI0028A49FE3|nr:hypothetical protein [Sphaerochaeta sp. PS]MDT4761877.1 hypothetical protein [Sphaerochaeta sp. PS]
MLANKEYRVNNLDWYTKVILFCKASTTCKECPFYLLQLQETETTCEERQCFKSKEGLEHLSLWLSESGSEMEAAEDVSDNQWLKDLLKGQFEDDENDVDSFFMDDELI